MNHVFEIKGMSCQNCVRHATEALQSLPGVGEVLVTLEPARGDVRHDGSLSFEAIAAALDDEGYEAIPLT